MQVTGWTDWENPNYEAWDDCPSRRTVEEYNEAFQTIAAELRAKGYMFSGYYHQGGDFGVPLIDGMRFEVTYRRWGGIMALAYPDKIDNSEGFGYLDWAWSPKEEQIVPTKVT